MTINELIEKELPRLRALRTVAPEQFTLLIPEHDLLRMRTLKARDLAPVEEIDALLASVRREKALAELESDRKGAEITPPHWKDTRETEWQRQNATLDLMLLTRGFTHEDGINDPTLTHRMNRPGLAELQRLESRLLGLRDRAIEREREKSSSPWPRPFRYTGKPGRMQIDGRHLETGDVVSLSESQATSFGDRFEEVTPAAVST